MYTRIHDQKVLYARKLKESIHSLDEKCQEYREEVASLSLDVSNLTDIQQKFVFLYRDHHDPFIVGSILELTDEETFELWSNKSVQTALERLNKKLFHEQILQRLVSIDELGGYLTSQLLDDSVDSDTKLAICKMLIDLNKLKATLFTKPTNFIYKNIPKEPFTISKINKFLKSYAKPQHHQDVLTRLPPQVSLSERNFLDTLPNKQFNSITSNIINRTTNK